MRRAFVTEAYEIGLPSDSLYFLPSGVCDLGELPGYLIAHPREGGLGQAPLVYSPDLSD